MQERMKEHYRDRRLARTQNSAVSEHANSTGNKPLWNETKLTDRESHWYTRKMKEVIYIRLNPNNINRDNGAEIPEAWMPTIRKHQNQQHTKNQRTPEETMLRGNNDRIERHQSLQTTVIDNAAPQPVDPITWRRPAVSSRNVAFHIKWLCRETTEQTYNIIQLPRWTTTYFITNIAFCLKPIYQNKKELPGTSMAFGMTVSRFEESHCLRKSSLPLPWQPNLIKTSPTGVISKLTMQTREPIPTPPPSILLA